MRDFARRERVSPELEKELALRGVAQAVVYLEPPDHAPRNAFSARRGNDMGDLDSCFVKDERSVSASLASASLAMTARDPRRHHKLRALAPPRYYSDIPRLRYFPWLGILLGDIHHDGLERLASHPRVRFIASSAAVGLIRPSAGRTAALAADTTWGIEMMEIPRLWNAGLDGQGVRVGHLDTGVDASHPALSGAVAAFLFVDEHGIGDPSIAAFDTEEHGTHTAGTIAGRVVSGRAIGVAPAASLYSAAVCDGGNLAARILAGMEWAAASGVRVLNLSIGMRPYQEDFRPLMATLRSNGILPVCAVGNNGPGTSNSPGNYDIVLSVGNCDAHREVDRTSSSQWFARPEDPLVPDLVAPGVDVISARPGGGYQSLDGSSQAVPHISGLAALLWQACPEATVEQVEDAIFESCTLGSMPQDRANRGLPNAAHAYEILMGSQVPTEDKPPVHSTASVY
ncbi:MAG TPA: S8 family serine peptidase [Steroidobacteraceae bacterium]|nr:S8 family serine peptidase [Steroidobacteraceae bacterium]